MSSSTDRLFLTDPSVTMEDALPMIRAALDDEGLALGPSAARSDNVTSVISRGVKTFRVPSQRVMTREQDQSMRAAWAAQQAQKEEHVEP